MSSKCSNFRTKMFLCPFVIYVGPFVTNIYKLMAANRGNTLKPDRNLHVYSGHDVSLINIMRALNITSQTNDVLDFGAALYFELHENQVVNQLEVKVGITVHYIRTIFSDVFRY